MIEQYWIWLWGPHFGPPAAFLYVFGLSLIVTLGVVFASAPPGRGR